METKLIVGLGNPSKKYEDTRHNIGFMFIDMLSEKYDIKFKEKFDGLIGEANIGGFKVLLLKPQTFMNLSGTSVKKVVDFYKIDIENILLIFDDLDLPFSKIKLKISSSAGGHNGVKDIINKLHTKDILRIKYGILNEYKKDTKDFVLSKFSKEELKYIKSDFSTIDSIFNDFIRYESKDYLKLLNDYN